MRAYHFVGKRLRDGRPVPKDGEKLIFKGKPTLCVRGLHASIHPFDALKYAPGETLCLVEMGGKIIESDDKVVATERTIIRRIDAAELLRYFARMQALRATEYWDPPQIVLEYLWTGDESIRNAARDAALHAARDAALVDSFVDVVGDAAWAAAWAASRDDARRAALTAAKLDAAAPDTTRNEFEVLVLESLQ